MVGRQGGRTRGLPGRLREGERRRLRHRLLLFPTGYILASFLSCRIASSWEPPPKKRKPFLKKMHVKMFYDLVSTFNCVLFTHFY